MRVVAVSRHAICRLREKHRAGNILHPADKKKAGRAAASSTSGDKRARRHTLLHHTALSLSTEIFPRAVCLIFAEANRAGGQGGLTSTASGQHSFCLRWAGGGGGGGRCPSLCTIS
jgi:hypothetical protein